MQHYDRPLWQIIWEEAIPELGEPLSADDAVEWVLARYPKFKASTVLMYLRAMAANESLDRRPVQLFRTDAGLYRKYDRERDGLFDDSGRPLTAISPPQRENKSLQPTDTQGQDIRPAKGRSRPKRTFGPPLNFRELRHEPVNEQGVVYLFGMVARELGFLVDAVGTGFPDCRAKRRDRTGYYLEIDVEFEFKSSNFRQHGHDPEGCDLIVCWEHDWAECPVELLELKSAIRQLDSHVGGRHD